MKAIIFSVVVMACSQQKDSSAHAIPVVAPTCSPSVIVKYVDLEAERFKRDHDFRTGKRRVSAICETDWVHWSAVGQVDWCKAKASEFDCGYDSWMDAWPPADARPWTAEGSFKTVGACCFDDPASKFDCAYMKERAGFALSLPGGSIKSHVTPSSVKTGEGSVYDSVISASD